MKNTAHPEETTPTKKVTAPEKKTETISASVFPKASGEVKEEPQNKISKDEKASLEKTEASAQGFEEDDNETMPEVKAPELPKKKSFFGNTDNVFATDPDKPLKSSNAKEDNDKPFREKSNKHLFVLGIGVFLATVAVTFAVGFFLLNNPLAPKKDFAPKEKAVVVSPTPAPVVIKRESWSFEVLNGSGVSGAGAKAGDTLEKLGYKVDKIGNADTSDYTQNTIYVAAGKKDDEIKALIADLKDKFGDVTNGGELKDSKSTVRLIIGAKQ